MNIMLCLCAICAVMTVMLLLTKFLSKKRKWILIGMEVIATFLLFFDRMAYIYSGNPSTVGYIMVRVSNFFVFFMTSAIVFCFNFYLCDLLVNEGKVSKIPRRLTFTAFVSAIGMLLAIIAAFTGAYYYFDSQNVYHRGPYFILCYIIPVLCPIIQFTAIFKFRKCFSKFINCALFLYVFLPIIMGIVQVFAYGISIANMTMVLVSVSLYFFTYLDANDAVEKAHKIEIMSFKKEREGIKEFFNNASAAFAEVFENMNGLSKGYSERIAQISREIGKKVLKSDEECEKIYYSAYLCDAGPEALSHIKEYHFLSQTALYVGERYDGKGNTKNLKGDEIPEYARIVSVAKDYDNMINNPSIPKFFIRDYFIRQAGLKYDPIFAKIAVLLIDLGTNTGTFAEAEKPIENELLCTDYRQNITTGIEITQNITDITFDCALIDSAVDSMLDSIMENDESKNHQRFSLPSIILFDSSDKQVQKTQDAIDAHKYIEYGEIWFDSHVISTSARNIEVRNVQQINTE